MNKDEINKAAKYINDKMKDKSLTISELIKLMGDYESENPEVINEKNNKKIWLTNAYHCSTINYIRVLANINNHGETYILLSPNYYDGPDQFNILCGSEIYIKIFLNTLNNLPYYEIKIKK